MNSRLHGVLFLIGCLGVIAGGFLSWIGWQEWTIYSSGSPTPQQISAAELAADGPGDNIHVKVTDFTLGIKYVVPAKKDKWHRLWVPMFPVGPAGRRGEIKIVVETSHVADHREFDRFYERHRQQPLTGIITSDFRSLGPKLIEELKKNYPGADFSSVLVIQEGRGFPSLQEVLWLLGGGVVLISLGLAAVVWVARKQRIRRQQKESSHKAVS
jgi:hypothetical protein